jgi:very-short-patch-repair endonuclease
MPKIYNRTSEKEKRRLLRNNLTRAEVILWSRLQRKQILGYKFRRQFSVGSYVIDFYCPELKLAIEIDGTSPFKEEIEKYDHHRQESIEKLGISFLRFTNNDIYKNLNGIVQVIGDKIQKMKPSSLESPPYQGGD